MAASMTSFANILSALEQRPPTQPDRRQKLRYPLDLSVSFRFSSGASPFTGAGRVVNVSSGGVLVVSKRVVSPHECKMGARVEMSIEWPFLLDGRVPLQFFAQGRVVRRGEGVFAAAFERRQFRTVRTTNLLEWPANSAPVLH
jgi:hypothetical protein